MKKPLFACLISIFVLAVVLFPVPALANSMAPPSIVVIVQNPPSDLKIELLGNDQIEQGHHEGRILEGYYAFYDISRWSDSTAEFKVTTGGKSFTCSTDIRVTYSESPEPGDVVRADTIKWDRYYTLDLATQQLEPETTPWRSWRAVALRVLLTLAIEGIIFLLFGFRKKASWIAFIAINLVTQTALNLTLGNLIALYQGTLGYNLIFGEFLVFVVEMVAFPLIVRERIRGRGQLRLVVYAFVANLASLLLGGYIFEHLPV